MKAIIVDDEQRSINRLLSLIKNIHSIDIIGTYTNPDLALKDILIYEPDLLFTDIEMPGMTGFKLINKIREAGFECRFVFVTAFDHYAIKAIKESAFDYLLKPIDIDQLLNMINRIQNSEKKQHNNLKQLADKFNITEREYDVLLLVLEGKNSVEIGNRLFLSCHTINTHRRNILNKIGVRNTTELILKFNAN